MSLAVQGVPSEKGHVLGNFEREGAAVVRGGPGRGHAGDDFVGLGVDLNQRLMASA